MTCSTKDCKHPAKCAPVVNVPAKGWPLGLHPPLKIIMGLPLCHQCFDSLKIADLLSDDLKQIFQAAAIGKCPPDFDRVFISESSISSPEFLMLQKKRKYDA